MTPRSSFASPRAWITAAALLFAAACTLPPTGPVNRYSGNENPHAMQKVEGNKVLASNLEIANTIATRRNGLLTVQFDLVNKNSAAQQFQWAVDWQDRQGLQVANVTRHWEPMRLAGYASQTITIVAPSAEAESWQLQVGARDEVQ